MQNAKCKMQNSATFRETKSIFYFESYVCTNKAGVQGAAPPAKENDVILRRRPQTALPPKDLVPTELFLGRRGAVTKWSALHPPGYLVFAPKLHSDHHTSD